MERNEEDKQKQDEIKHLKKKILGILAILLFVTAIGQVSYNMLTPRTFLTGRISMDLDEFKAYMETPSEEYLEDEGGNMIYYDRQGNEVSKEEALTEEIYTADEETLLGQYIHKNREVVRVDCHWKGDSLTIVAYTGGQALQKDSLIQALNL